LFHALTPVGHELAGLKRLAKGVKSRGTTLQVHLKIDTGMRRLRFLATVIRAWLSNRAEVLVCG
jgi:alanine racemase